MFTLKKAAEVFNKLWFSDPEATTRFQGQLLPFTDNVRSAPTTKRRILEVSPDLSVPPVIINEETGETYIVGLASHDFFREKAVRSKYPLIPVLSEMTVGSPFDILSGTEPVLAWGSISYIRREIIQDASDFFGGYYLTFPGSFELEAGDIAYVGGDYYRARELSYIDELGFAVMDSIRYTTLIQTLDIVIKGTYEPVTETYSGGSTTATTCLVEPREKAFFNYDQSAEDNLHGDVTITSLTSCSVGDEIGNYTIINKHSKDSVYLYHARAK